VLAQPRTGVEPRPGQNGGTLVEPPYHCALNGPPVR
jgi:hypothetical protein